MSLIGITGSHRVGKSTLAGAIAEKHSITFAETSVSAIFKDLGHDPAAGFDFATRLDIQEEILRRVDAMYGLLDPTGTAITDRTPIDFLAYTLSEANGDTVRPDDQKRLADYMTRCFDVVNRRFSTLILVQPGIPLVCAPGKAVMNAAYIEHLNSLCLGLSSDERVKPAHFYIQRRVLSLEGRIAAVENAIGRARQTACRTLETHLEQGGLLQ